MTQSISAILPPPLVPAECSMGGNDWFPFYFDRLRKSKWWRRASDLCRARNVMLWGEAYKATPAGSLPDDDDELAEGAGFGMDVDAFLRAKDEIMAPWVLCADGRWYHPTVCEVVLDAWERTSERRQREARRKAEQRAKIRDVPPKSADVPRDMADVPRDTPPETGLSQDVPAEIALQTDRTGQDRQDKQDRGERTPAAAHPARSSRLSTDWVPNDIDRAYAAKQGFSLALIERIAEKFRNYWTAKSGKAATKLDWSATWRNWVLEEAERRGTAPKARSEADWC